MPGRGDAGTSPIPAEPRSDPPLEGEFDRTAFDVVGVVGRGGNATVSEATLRTDPDRVVALKEPHITDDVPDVVVERFRTEAETWADLDDHPHVVTVHAWGTEPHPWLALEYMDGGTLVERGGRCGLAQGLWIGACVASALEHAHGEGVAHLDLKPGNVLFRASPGDAWPVPAVGDWGLAWAFRSERTTLEGLSPSYAAPEQFAQDRFGPPGAATDVYQLGVVLYEQLVGEPPFGGPPGILRDAVLEESPPPPSGRNPSLPAVIDDVLDRALAKDPGTRYESMGAFRSELERLLADRTGFERTDGESRSGRAGRSGGVEVTDRWTGRSTYERALTLAEEGFVQLSEGYFTRRGSVSELEAWRRGVTLADARAGRAVDRTVSTSEADDRTSLTERLVAGLADGTDHVLLGPPASGKSTVCKKVACEWYDRGHGAVYYRESGEGSRFDRPAALSRQVSDGDGHALVVVEDAVRPEANAVFEFIDLVRDVEDVTILLDTREAEWHEAHPATGPFGLEVMARGREDLEPVFLPRPDRREFERFVGAVEAATDRPVDVDLEELRGDVERAAAEDGDADVTRPGELFYLLHRLTAVARDPLEGERSATALTAAVEDVYDRLAAAGERVLDVGICANVLNATSIGIQPDLLYAVVPDDPLTVDNALDVLDGRVVFPREADWSQGATTYPAIHEAWSTTFLAHFLQAEGETDASDRFGRVVTQMLSLADGEALRKKVSVALRDDVAHLDRLEQHPTAWGDAAVEALYTLGREQPRLGPLFGDGKRDSIGLPAACSAVLVREQPVRLGWLFLAGGYYDRAEAAFGRLPETPDDLAVERLLGLSRVADQRGEYRTGADLARECLESVDGSDRPHAWARAHLGVGRCLRELGEYSTARDHYQSALDGFRAVEDRRRTARTLNSLGRLARQQSEYERALECYERSLEIDRSIGDRRGEAQSLNNLGIVAFKRSEYERAREYFERSLDIQLEIGARQGAANSLNNLGEIQRRLGVYDRAREYYERSLERKRELGDRPGEASSLNNLGLVARQEGEYDLAREYFERCLDIERAVGAKRDVARCLNNLGLVARHQGEFERARRYHQQSLTKKAELGDRHAESTGLDGLGEVAYCRSELERAREYFERSRAIKENFGDRSGVGTCLNNLGMVAHEQGAYERARDHFKRSLHIHGDVGDRAGEATSRSGLGMVGRKQGHTERARAHLEQSLETAEDVGIPIQAARSRYHLAEIARMEGDYDEAETHVRRASAAVDDRFETTKLQLVHGRILLSRGEIDIARDRADQVHEAFEAMDATLWIGRNRRLLGRVAQASGDHDTASEQWREALESFEDVGAYQDALATLQDLARISRQVNDDEAAGRWCNRAESLVESAPKPVADLLLDWIRTTGDVTDDI